MKTLLTILLAFSVHILNAQTIPVFTPDKKNIKPKVEKVTKKEIKTVKSNNIVQKKEIINGYVENFRIVDNGIGSCKYFGVLKNGKPEGKGKLYSNEYSNYLFYEGNFKEGRKEGYGTEYYLNDKCTSKIAYQGFYKDDQFDGDGIFYYCASPPFYSIEGIFKEGKNIQGKLKLENGDQFEGSYEQQGKFWAKDVATGKYIFANGDIYEGEFKNKIQNGWGTYTWADGQKFTGTFVNGDILGKGTMTFTNKSYKTAWFERTKDKLGFKSYIAGDSEDKPSYTYRSSDGTPLWPIKTPKN
jgi:hypothetical protein